MGCGGAPEAEETAPVLPAPVADDLAGRADAVAAHLAAGDACAAAGEADDLVHATVAAIQAGDVPPPLQEELLAGAQSLLHGIDCQVSAPAPAPAPAPEDDEGDDDEDEDEDEEKPEKEKRDKGMGKGKGKGRG